MTNATHTMAPGVALVQEWNCGYTVHCPYCEAQQPAAIGAKATLALATGKIPKDVFNCVSCKRLLCFGATEDPPPTKAKLQQTSGRLIDRVRKFYQRITGVAA